MKLIRELRAENARLRALLADATVMPHSVAMLRSFSVVFALFLLYLYVFVV